MGADEGKEDKEEARTETSRGPSWEIRPRGTQEGTEQSRTSRMGLGPNVLQEGKIVTDLVWLLLGCAEESCKWDSILKYRRTPQVRDP